MDIIVNMRSVDLFLGLPFDIASYAILLKMVAKEVNMTAGTLTMNLADTHIYENHLEYIYELLKRESKAIEPNLELTNKSIWNAELEDFKLVGYESHPNWKNVKVAV